RSWAEGERVAGPSATDVYDPACSAPPLPSCPGLMYGPGTCLTAFGDMPDTLALVGEEGGMAWRTASVEGQRLDFVFLASLPGALVSELCRRFGISRQTGHLWLRRFRAGELVLADRSRRPRVSPDRSPAALEACVLAVRDAHPAWGARKIAWRLQQDGVTP